jgi:hypothetical protein
MDEVLHQERFKAYQTDWREKKRTYTASLDNLPVGAFVTLEAGYDITPYLVLDDSLRSWSFAGYGRPIPRPSSQFVTVLTPPSTVRTLAQGYRPQIYPEPY